MGYMKKIYHLRNGQQVSEYHNRRRSPKGETRKEKRQLTPEQMKANNQRMKNRKVQRLLLNNFSEGDKYLTLTYPEGEDPETVQEVNKDFRNMIAYLKKYYKAAEIDVKWAKNIERTKRGIFHIHAVINNCPGCDIGQIARRYWKERHAKVVRVEETYLDGGFEKLGNYLAKTERSEDGRCVSIFSHSRNVQDVEPETKEYVRNNVRSNGTWKEIKVPKGFELVKESVFEGFDPIGYPVRHYTLIRTGSGALPKL